MTGLLANLLRTALVLSIVPLTVSCSVQSAVKQGEKGSTADQEVTSLSGQYKQKSQESAQKDFLEARRQLRFLGGRILYLFPPVLTSFDKKPYPFAVEQRSSAIKVFVCDSVRDGIVPETQDAGFHRTKGGDGFQLGMCLIIIPKASRLQFTGLGMAT